MDGTLIRHSSATLLEVALGLIAGSFLATILGYLLAKSFTLERLLSPYLVASQAIPIVAIAPLMVIWFGPGLFSKVLIAALIVFFPDFGEHRCGCAGSSTRIARFDALFTCHPQANLTLSWRFQQLCRYF